MRQLLLLVLVACRSDPSGGSIDGAAIYQRYCASCHGAEGKPSATMVAQLAVRDLTAPELRARITQATVEQQVRAGSPNRLMPAFEGGLSAEQIRAVAAFVASPDFPRPPAATGSAP